MKYQWYMISIMCEDTVGLVAHATGAIADIGGNIEEMYQGVLRGYFVLNLLISFDEPFEMNALRSHLEKVGNDHGFVISVLPRPEAALPPKISGECFILNIEGNDEPGILNKLTSYLAGRHINIEDISSWSGDGKYIITVELTTPESVDTSAVRLELSEILGSAAVSVQLLHRDIFAATSQISMHFSARKDKP